MGVPKIKRRFRPEFDGLDRRCLMAAGMTATLARGVLKIRGTNAADVIIVNFRGGSSHTKHGPTGTIQIDGLAKVFRISRIKQITVEGRGGDDIIAVRGRSNFPIRIDGGGGMDTVNGIREAETTTAPTAPPFAEPLSAVCQQVVDLVNQQRQLVGLAPLRVNGKLVSAALLHAGNMARLNTLAHELPGAAQPTLTSRIDFVGYQFSWLGENIAYNYRDAASVMNAWLHSPEHRANILDPNYTEIGVGLAINGQGEFFYCQDFGRPL